MLRDELTRESTLFRIEMSLQDLDMLTVVDGVLSVSVILDGEWQKKDSLQKMQSSNL